MRLSVTTLLVAGLLLGCGSDKMPAASKDLACATSACAAPNDQGRFQEAPLTSARQPYYDLMYNVAATACHNRDHLFAEPQEKCTIRLHSSLRELVDSTEPPYNNTIVSSENEASFGCELEGVDLYRVNKCIASLKLQAWLEERDRFLHNDSHQFSDYENFYFACLPSEVCFATRR